MIDGFVHVQAAVEGPLRELKNARLLLDTGTRNTILDIETAEEAGYPASCGLGVARFRSIAGEEVGYTVRLPSLTALGRKVDDYLVACTDLKGELNIDGILGLDFFQNADLTVGLRSQHLELAW
ncbi:MAG: retropepsin-like domain-containing protein [Candidatus Wallbacteria bacterium]|nr:retropepsin-like domain-containing protein [Candidatus Wallbacteria bacterium]